MRWILAVLLLNLCSIAFADEPVDGTWYRNMPFAEATMKVDRHLHFHIDASYAANFGEIDGTLQKIKTGLYYSVIDEKEIGQNCLIVMAIEGKLLEVTLYGDEVGAGAGVFYQGKYHRRPLTEAQFRREALQWILPEGLKQRTVVDLLGKDLDYFIGCFAVRTSTPPIDGYIRLAYEGFTPGVADYQNGILALGNRYLYILFLDVRQQKPKFQFFTNAPAGTPLPKTLKRWIGTRTDVPIVRHYDKTSPHSAQ